MAEGRGRPTFTDLSGAPPHLTVPGFDRSGNLLPRREDLIQYAKVKRMPYGAVQAIQRDAPRLSAERARAFIAENRPELTPERVEELAGEWIGGMRTRTSDRRVSLVDAKVQGNQVTLKCRVCGAKPLVNRKDLAMVIEKAKRDGGDVYVSPRGNVRSTEAVAATPLRV
jgi:hypothetical protein